jgi:hypothetical protein
MNTTNNINKSSLRDSPIIPSQWLLFEPLEVRDDARPSSSLDISSVLFQFNNTITTNPSNNNHLPLFINELYLN